MRRPGGTVRGWRMTLNTNWDGLFNAGTAVLEGLVGLAIVLSRPRRRINVAFALFAAGWAVGLTINNLLAPGDPDRYAPALRMTRIVANVVAATGIIWFIRLLRPPELRRDIPGIVLAWAAGIAFFAAEVWYDWSDDADLGIFAEHVQEGVIRGAWLAFLVLCAVRFRAAAGPGRALWRHRLGLSAAAMVAWPGVVITYDQGEGVVPPLFPVGALLLGLISLLWIRNTLGETGWASRTARNLALVAFVPAILALVMDLLWKQHWSTVGGPQYGFARLLSVSILGYAVLKYQHLGIELRLKSALRVALVVLACLVVATLGFLAERPWTDVPVALMLAATGALAAFAAFRQPLLRWSDRMAGRLMPGVEATHEYFERRNREIRAVAGNAIGASEPFPGPSILAAQPTGVLAAAAGEAGSSVRLQAYARQMRRHLAAGGASVEVADLLRPLRADLGVTEKEHALLEIALRDGRTEAIEAGQVFLRRYRVERTLGRGAFATTYLASDLQAARQAAIKVVRSPTQSAQGLKSVLHECRLLAAVNHPNVVTLYDVEAVGDEAYLVQEYVGGGTLRDRLARGPLDPPAFRRFARDLLSGLEAVHGQGIVHGDVKPSNVLFGADGTAKLADFGIARMPGFEATMGGTRLSEGAVGTIRYMSPEVARGKPPGPRSDLFGAAVALCEAWTGRSYLEPRPGETAFQLQTRAAKGGGLPSGWSGPPGLRAWFAKALSHAPERRFASAAVMRDALQAALASADGARPKP